MRTRMQAALAMHLALATCSPGQGTGTSSGDTSETGKTSEVTPTTSTTAQPGNLPPVAEIVGDLGEDLAAPLRVELASGSSDPDGSIVAVHWDFGDGASADGEKVSHVYATEGTYELRLTVVDDDGASGETTRAVSVGGCPRFQPGKSVGKLATEALTEASGLAFSRQTPGVVWTHNDSEDAPRLYTFTDLGAPLGTYALQGVEVRDWEDMALGPGPKQGQDYLYVGDIGDNNAEYAAVFVHRVAEPPVDPATTGVDASLGGVESFQLTLPGGPRNCETMLVDPVSGDLYLVSKSVDGVSLVFRAAAPLKSGMLTEVATLELGAGGLTTGGSVTAAGDWVVVRTYFAVRMWHRAAGTALHKAFAGAGCEVPVAMEMQGEAIGFAAQGLDYYTTSEGAQPPLYRFTRG
ncbi:MAG TPA: PKD domain-containing protein [Nannocystis sp.]|jgi:PKD repeat protein